LLSYQSDSFTVLFVIPQCDISVGYGACGGELVGSSDDGYKLAWPETSILHCWRRNFVVLGSWLDLE